MRNTFILLILLSSIKLSAQADTAGKVKRGTIVVKAMPAGYKDTLDFIPSDTLVYNEKTYVIKRPAKYSSSLLPKFLGPRLILTDRNNNWSDYYITSFKAGLKVNGAIGEFEVDELSRTGIFSRDSIRPGIEMFISAVKAADKAGKKISIPGFKIVRIK